MSDISNAAPSSANLDAWLKWLETLSPREIELGLDRVQSVLERLHLPRPWRVVSVAGTNGKGSTVAYLESLYAVGGHKVACYTSPHVLKFNERMRVDGQDLSDADIVSAFRAVEAVRGDTPLTYFEFGTLAALVAFAAASADVYVLEIGLGGRLDAVNAIDPDGAVITNVSLDHCDWLGDNVEAIAREKAGVMRAGIPVVYSSKHVPAAVPEIAGQCGANLLLAGRDYSHAPDGKCWAFAFNGLPAWSLARPSLDGAFQFDNAAGAIALFVALEGPQALPPDAISSALSAVRLPGRLHSITTDRSWLLDVAHNPAAAEALAIELQRLQRDRQLVAVIGVLADKDLDSLLRPLLPLVDSWIAVTADSARALPALNLAVALASMADRPCRVAGSIADGLSIARSLANENDLILVSGSFYTVGPALSQLDPVAGRALGYTRGALERDM